VGAEERSYGSVERERSLMQRALVVTSTPTVTARYMQNAKKSNTITII